MNTKNKITFILLAVLCCVFFYYCMIRNDKLVVTNNALSEIETNSMFKENFLDVSSYNAEFIHNFQQFQNKNESDIMFERLPIIIYRYSQFICENCIQHELEALSKLQNEIGKERIWVLPEYENTRNNRVKLLNMLHKFNYKIVSDEELPMPMRRDGEVIQSFFFFVQEESRIGMIFFPEVSKPQLTQSYFAEIKNKLENAK